jgi:hypothetical protein
MNRADSIEPAFLRCGMRHKRRVVKHVAVVILAAVVGLLAAYLASLISGGR